MKFNWYFLNATLSVTKPKLYSLVSLDAMDVVQHVIIFNSISFEHLNISHTSLTVTKTGILDLFYKWLHLFPFQEYHVQSLF